MRKTEIKSTADLRRMLIDTIGQVRAGKIDTAQARAVSSLSTTVLQSAKLDLEFLKFHAANEGLVKDSMAALNLIAG